MGSLATGRGRTAWSRGVRLLMKSVDVVFLYNIAEGVNCGTRRVHFGSNKRDLSGGVTSDEERKDLFRNVPVKARCEEEYLKSI